MPQTDGLTSCHPGMEPGTEGLRAQPDSTILAEPAHLLGLQPFADEKFLRKRQGVSEAQTF